MSRSELQGQVMSSTQELQGLRWSRVRTSPAPITNAWAPLSLPKGSVCGKSNQESKGEGEQ